MKLPSTTVTVSGRAHQGASRRIRERMLVVTPASPTPAPFPEPATSELTVIRAGPPPSHAHRGSAEIDRHATDSRRRVGLPLTLVGGDATIGRRALPGL